MTTHRRGLIEKELQNLEAGRFQELMLGFLPLFDARFNGIQRFGGTEFGKTRAGTPDLLRTLPTGEQVACECGTEIDYWTPPKGSTALPRWKPIADALKCIGALARPIEIVIASNQPLPTRYPNAQSLLLDELAKSSPCKITLFSSESLAQWLLDNSTANRVLELLRAFLPEAAEGLVLSVEKDIFDATVAQSRRFGLPVPDIAAIVRSVGPHSPDLDRAVQDVVVGDDSAFRVLDPSVYQGIQRCARRLPALLEPFGRIFQLLGAPKIGKSFILGELLAVLKCHRTWLQAPLDERQEAEFVDAALLALLSPLWPRDTVLRFLVSGALPDPRDALSGPTPTLVCLDNLHYLTPAGLKRIEFAMKLAKGRGGVHLAVILLSNQNLETQLSPIDQTLAAPLWNAEELLNLLALRGVQAGGEDQPRYLEILAVHSRGHPLFALALAKRWPTTAELANSLVSPPSSPDQDLSKEIKNVLYQDILTTSDRQNLVQRLSLLLGRAQTDVVDALRTKVDPVIQLPAQALCDEIGPAVLEGRLTEGINVSPVFRDVAQSRIGEPERTRTYLAAADVLLGPKDNILRVDRATDGIHCLAFASQIGRAASWAMRLLLTTENDHAEKKKRLTYLLGRLSLLAHLKEPKDVQDALPLWAMKLAFAHYYGILGRDKEAASIFRSIDFGRLRDTRFQDSQLEYLRTQTRVGLTFCRISALALLESPQLAILDLLELARDGPSEPSLPDLVPFLPLLIGRLSPERMASLEFDKLVPQLVRADDEVAWSVALQVGVQLAGNAELEARIRLLHESGNAHLQLFSLIAQSEWLLERSQFADALEMCERVRSLASRTPISELGARWHQHQADVLFGLRRDADALEEYRASNGLEKDIDGPCTPWNNLRIGVTTQDVDERVEALGSSARRLIQTGNYGLASRAKGALAAHWVQMHEYAKAVAIGMKLADWLFERGTPEVGPALRLLLANMWRVHFIETGKEAPAEFPEVELRHYTALSDEAQFSGGGIGAYFTLGRLAQIAKDSALAASCFRRAMNADITGSIDRESIAGVWAMLVGVEEPGTLTPDVMRGYLARLIQYQPPPGTEDEARFFSFVTEPFLIERAWDSETRAKLLVSLVQSAEQVISAVDAELASRWRPYLGYCQGVAKRLQGNLDAAYAQLRAATTSALSTRQWKIGMDAGALAAFVLGTRHASLRDAASSQYDLLLCIEGSGMGDDRLETFGINLFRYWSSITWRRLSEYDLRVKELLMDTAKELRAAGFAEGEAAWIMVAALIQALNHPIAYTDKLRFVRQPSEDVLRRLGRL